jgi:polyisoprenoid-binding protein YceI
MKKTLVVTILMLCPAIAYAEVWEIDPAHSQATFSVRHLMISDVRGELGKVTGTVNLDEKSVAKSSVEASVDVTAINTREAKRDAHLKGPEFFDVKKYPTITFKSKTFKKKGGKKYAIAGDLTMHGVTKPVTLEAEISQSVKDPWGMMRRGAHATTSVNRKDFGLNWNKALETGGVVVGDKIDITLDVEGVLKPEATAANTATGTGAAKKGAAVTAQGESAAASGKAAPPGTAKPASAGGTATKPASPAKPAK